jgi:hypothetical protein
MDTTGGTAYKLLVWLPYMVEFALTENIVRLGEEGGSCIGMSSFGESEQALVVVLLGGYAAPCSPMTQIGVN